MELSILTPRGGFQGIRGCESEMEQGLGRKWQGGSGTFATHSLVNTFLVRQTDGN